jgi:hypothetical protein
MTFSIDNEKLMQAYRDTIKTKEMFRDNTTSTAKRNILQTEIEEMEVELNYLECKQELEEGIEELEVESKKVELKKGNSVQSVKGNKVIEKYFACDGFQTGEAVTDLVSGKSEFYVIVDF